MHYSNTHILSFLLSLSAMLLLQACSSGGESGNSQSSGDTGTVGVLLTDAPADPDSFISINVAIEKIELMGGDDNRVAIYDGPTQSFDLLRLRNESIPFSFEDEVPVGEYCKIRLTLESLELVLTDDTPLDDSDNERAYPNLPGNNKLDLNIRDCIEVEADQTLALQLDIDARRSIHVTGNGNRFQFRPVVFVDAVQEDFDAKLLRLEGRIVAFDEARQQVLVCSALPTEQMANAGCVVVQLNEHSALFDNLTQGGAPQDLSTLFVADQLGETLQIVGWPRRPGLFDTAPAPVVTTLPEAEQCIVWDIFAPENEQALPIDCNEVPDTLNSNEIVVSSTGIMGHRLRPLMRINGLALKQGTFITVEGEPVTDADASGFDLNLTNGDPTILSNPLPVVLQPDNGDIKGTRVVSKAGELLDYSAILAGVHSEVDGALINEQLNNMWLNAALVILDEEPELLDQASGTVSEVNDSGVVINLGNSTLCGQSVSSLTIDSLDDLQVLTVTITDDASEVSMGGTAEVGQEAGISGECEGVIFTPLSLVLVSDLRTAP
ncbi:MAG: DUF4382 domain-containing protein [Oleiphilaceae bacterium]|nr:DUF4382 domain-containing protein [Oleiphilaceae bacterium]